MQLDNDGVQMQENPLDAIHQAIILFSRNSKVRANDMYSGLSFITYTMLSYVDTFPEPTASDVSERYGLEKSTVSRQLAQLENDGLLCRAPNPSQPRTKLLQLTETGRTCLTEIRQHQHEGLRERLSHWSDDDIEAFSRLLWRFVSDTD